MQCGFPFSGCQTLLPSQKFNMIHLRKWRQKGIGDSAFEKHHFMVPAVQLGSFSQPNLWWNTVLHNRVWCCHNMWQTFLVKNMKFWKPGVFTKHHFFLTTVIWWKQQDKESSSWRHAMSHWTTGSVKGITAVGWSPLTWACAPGTKVSPTCVRCA